MASSEQKNIQEELQELAPNLAKLREVEKPLEVPVHYFDQLSTDLLEKVRKEQSSTSTTKDFQPFWEKLLQTLLQPKYAMAFAGVAILIIGLFLFSTNNIETPHHAITLSDQEISNYIELHIDDFDLNLLAEESSIDEEGSELFIEEGYLEDDEVDNYFDELLDEVDLEDLL